MNLELENESKHVFVFYLRSFLRQRRSFANTCALINPQRNAQSLLRVVLAWKSAGCVLCSNAMGEASACTDALQHCLQNLVGVRLSVLCSSARAGAGAVVLCSSFRKRKQAVLCSELCLCSALSGLPWSGSGADGDTSSAGMPSCRRALCRSSRRRRPSEAWQVSRAPRRSALW
jgi:hypothetical protein